MGLTAAGSSTRLSVPLLASGQLRTYTGSNPAANNEFSETVPALTYWKLLAVTVNMVATVQTPWSSLLIKDPGGTTIFQSLAGTAAATAGVTYQANWSPGAALSGAASDTVKQGTLPESLILGPGFIVASSTAGLGAQCDMGAPAFYVIELT